jgi:hypothetical protein
MRSAEEYRNRAAELHEKAEKAVTLEAAVELRQLARVYLRLAQDAERNARTVLVLEPPPPKLDERS